MKELTSCFIGIPLPEEHVPEFAELVGNLRSVYPDFYFVHDRTPHVSLMYLAPAAIDKLDEVEECVRDAQIHLEGGLVICGADSFSVEGVPTVLFLMVHHLDSLIDFNTQVQTTIPEELSGVNNAFPFHAHMSVARLRTPKAQEVFLANETDIQERLISIYWEFPITKVGIYASNSNTTLHQQEILRRISL